MDDASSEPAVMPLDLLREITNGFSDERKLGSGSFGKVYLGVHPYGEKIAVKMLYDMPGLDDEQFQNEFKILTRLEHQNIVRLVGYCHDIQEVQVQHQGRLVLAEKTHRALCLEYMSNGSLDKYLSDECDRYDWQKGYRMIKGICQGLNYLHNEIKPPIYHLDLKPANVLLDEKMIPRISDFGMSRLFGDEQTRTTKNSLGTIGYFPPEYITQNVVSSKFDIFSLGVVIIKIMAGRAGYFNIADMSSQEFTTLVLENWTNRLLVTSNRRNAYSEQVKICIEIGLSCVQEDRHKRPTIQDIVNRLKETETKCNYASRKDWLLIFQEANRKTFPQYAQDPNDRHSKQRYHGSTFNQSDVGTFLAVDCTPVDDNGRQGEFGMKFANSGNKITCGTEEEAAEAYDIAAIKFRGLNTVTNFEIGRYNEESISSSNLPIGNMSGGAGRGSKALESSSPDATVAIKATMAPPSLTFTALPMKYDQQQQDYLSFLALQHHQQGNLQGLGYGLYSSGVNLDFANAGGAMAALHCYGNAGDLHHHQQQHAGYPHEGQEQQQHDHQQQHQSNMAMLGTATPMATFSGGAYESSVMAGTFGYYPNVAAFQTPIFGME